MLNSKESQTKGGSMCAAVLDMLCNCNKITDKINLDTVIKSLKKCVSQMH